MRRWAKYGFAGAVLAGATVAGATSLPAFSSTNSGVLQSGASQTAVCQSTPLDITYTPNVTGIYLAGVTVSSINAACDGKYITVSTLSNTGSVLGTNHALLTAAQTSETFGYGDWPNEYISTIYAPFVDHVIVTFSDNAPSDS